MLTEEEKKAKKAARSKAYYEANKEKRAAKQKAYYEANKEKIATQKKAYHEANPEVHAKGCRKRRAIKKESYIPRCSYWESVERQMVEERERLRATGITYHIDHIYPLSKGGIDHPSNYQLLSPEENLSKGAKVDSSCPKQMRMKEVSELVLNQGMDIDSALQLTKEEISEPRSLDRDYNCNSNTYSRKLFLQNHYAEAGDHRESTSKWSESTGDSLCPSRCRSKTHLYH